MWKRQRRFVGTLVAACLVICLRGFAQRIQSALRPENILQAVTFDDSRPDLSPNGKWLAYTLRDPVRARLGGNANRFFSDTGTPTAESGTDVWITDTDSGRSQNLTFAKGSNWGGAWSPDSKLLAFYSDRDGNVRVWIYNTETKAMSRVSESMVRVLDPWQVPRWSPDGAAILTKLFAQDELDAKDQNAPSAQASIKAERDRSLEKTLVYVSSERASAGRQIQESPLLVQDERTRAERADIGLITVATGAVRRIAGKFSPVWYSWSPDGSGLAFATMKGLERGEVYRGLFDLLHVSPTGETKIIAADIPRLSPDFSASWSPTGTELAYVSAGGEQNGECFVVPLRGGPRRKATNHAHPAFSPFHQAPVWSSSGESLYLLTSTYSLWTISAKDGRSRELSKIPGQRIYAIVRPSRGGHSLLNGERSLLVSTIDDSTWESGFYRIDPATGSFTKLRSENKNYDIEHMVSSDEGQKIVYAAEDIAHPLEYFISNSDFTNIRQLTKLDPSLTHFPMGSGRLVQWRSGDGDVVQGALLLPSNYEEGKRYPLIVEVYPGLFSPCVTQFGLCGENYFPNKQLLATRGYAVLMPDLRLTGKTIMADLAKIVLAGVNRTIDIGIADPDRVGLMGTSWGGYSTLALIVQTSRFKAAVMVAGFGDLLGFYGEMDESGSSLGIGILEGGTGQFSMPGTPWEYPDLYIANSPIFWLDRVKTPLLIIHGTKDTNVAPSLADEVFVGLRRLGKRATYVKYVGEVHGIHDYENQIDSFHRIVEWFDDYLGRNSPLASDGPPGGRDHRAVQ